MSQDRLSMVLRLAPGVVLTDLLRDVVAQVFEDLPAAPDLEDVMEQGFPVQWQSDNQGSQLCRIVIDLEEISGDESDRETFAKGLLSRLLADTGRVEACARFQDVRILERNRKLADEIFAIEMDIREVLTLLIGSASDTSTVESLIDQCILNPMNVPNADDLRAPHAENALFYLLFSDYSQVNRARKVDLPSVIRAIAEHDDFAQFQRFLTQIDVLDHEHLQTFLAQLKDLMDPVEKVRNAVAHNRVVRDRLHGSYQLARAKLQAVLAEALSAFE